MRAQDPSHNSPGARRNDPGARRLILATCAMMYFQGYVLSINSIASPWIARSFDLDESGIARVFAWISLSALGALLITRMADRFGRRRVLLSCTTATPLLAMAAASSTSLAAYTLIEMALLACVTATISGSVVLLAEGLPIEQRARGQSYGGMALGLGGGLAVLLMPILAEHGSSWRMLLRIAGGGLLLVPILWSRLPESERWRTAASSGATARSSFRDIFRRPHRRRALPVLLCQLLSTTAVTAVTSWGYFHAVAVNHLSATVASVMTLAGGGLSVVGLTGGAWSAERFGRVPTVAAAGLLLSGGGLFFYWGPPAGLPWPALWLGVGFCWFMVAVNGWMVAGNSAATELFPTALRTTMLGWMALMHAISSVFCQTMISLLAVPAGGLSVVVGYLALLAVPSAALFAARVEETRGLSLEDASRELPSAPQIEESRGRRN